MSRSSDVGGSAHFSMIFFVHVAMDVGAQSMTDDRLRATIVVVETHATSIAPVCLVVQKE